MSYGRIGRPLHEAMTNTIPLVIHALQRAWPDMGVGGSVCDHFMHVLMNTPKGLKGKQTPDGIICWDEGAVLIEIGMCNADKWPLHPWIHWSFTGFTTVINHDGDPMIDEVAGYLELAAKKPDVRQHQPQQEQLAA